MISNFHPVKWLEWKKLVSAVAATMCFLLSLEINELRKRNEARRSVKKSLFLNAYVQTFLHNSTLRSLNQEKLV